MNQTVLAVLVGFVAGIVGGYFGQSLVPSKGANAPLEADSANDLRRELDDLKQSLGAGAGVTLAGRDPAPRMLTAGAGGAALTEAAEAALLAQVDERVAAAVDKKIADLQSEEGGVLSKVRKREKKKVTLAEAAVELELSGQQEDELRRIYADSERKFLAMLAAPDGDPEDVKREIQAAAESPGGLQKAMMKYVPKLLPNIGKIMEMQMERDAAIVKTVGAESAKRLDAEFDVKESDFLGLGGGSMNFGASVEVDER